MAWLTRSSRLTLLMALTLGLAFDASPGQAQLRSNSLSNKIPSQWENSFRAPRNPNRPASEQREGGATRGPNDYDDQCIAEGEFLTAIVPASGVGNTEAEYPTVFWYMPQTSASAMEFVLKDVNEREVYRATFALASATQSSGITPGIRSLTLPDAASLPPLEIGQEYHWQLALLCDPIDRSTDIVADGRLKRVAPDPTLARQAQAVPLQDQVALYADKRLWYETLAILVELRRDRPDDIELAAAWDKLLNSVGLETISQASTYQGASNLNRQL